MAADLEGKVFLVTGATEGIGKAAALEFARRGADLTLVGRNREKTERVVAQLREQSGSERIAVSIGDLSRIDDARDVARRFRDTHDRLDVLVNNAGAIFNTLQRSADGFEMTFALNHLAYFVLATELLDLLRKTPGARVVSTSSAAHQMGRLDLATFARREQGYSGWRAYGDSKLANILFTRELARRLDGQGVAHCFHPGWVRTGFALNNGGVLASMVKATSALFARSPEKGAETLVWLATSPEATRVNGGYFHDRKVARTSAQAQDESLAARLWDFTAELAQRP